jgi:hypothetical protein
MACARAQFSGCSLTTNAHSKTGQMAVCCQNLPLGALSSRNAPSVLVGALFKKFGLFLNTGVYMAEQYINEYQSLQLYHKTYSENANEEVQRRRNCHMEL